MLVTLRFFSLVLALGTTLVAGCSLEREGSADALRDDDAPTMLDPDQRPTGQITSDASAQPAPAPQDGSASTPAPGLQTDAGSADAPKPPSADIPEASVPDAPAQPKPTEPAKPAEPAQPTQPAPTVPAPSTPPPSTPPPSTPPPSNPPPSDPPPSNPPPSNPPPQPPVGFSLSSSFPSNGELPLQYACDGASPPFSWSGAPGGVGSYALVLEQFDYGSASNRLLWAMVNIPGNINALPQGFASERARFQAPVCGGSQRYTYTLYALAQSPSFGNGVTSVTRTERLGGQVVFLPSGVLGTASIVAYVNR
ncbi:MAG: hypothetical protein ABW252_26120 [Polyangiales bacterium]